MNIGNVINDFDVTVNAAVEREVRRIGIDVFVASVVNGNLDEVFRRRKEIGDIKTERRIAAHVRADGATVDRNVTLAVDAVKLDVYLSGIFADDLGVGADTAVIGRCGTLTVKGVPGVGQVYRLFFVLLAESPAGVEQFNFFHV